LQTLIASLHKQRKTYAGMVFLFAKLITVASGGFLYIRKNVVTIYVYKFKQYFIAPNEIDMQTT